MWVVWDLCGAGPLVSVEPGGILYQRVQPSDASDIIAALQGPPVERIHLDSAAALLCPPASRLSLENCGRIDPERLEDYIAADGYLALTQCSERNDARRGDRRDPQERSARTRRRGLSHGAQMEHGRKSRRDPPRW